MHAWLSVLPAFGVGLLYIFLPGLLVLTAAGFRGWHRWALAAPTSFALAGAGAIVLDFLQLPFNPGSFAILVAATTLITFGLRRLIHHGKLLPGSLSRKPQEEQHILDENSRVLPWALVFAVAFPSIAIGTRLLIAIKSPNSIAQLFDNVFHLNATSIIAQTANGSSLTLGNLTEASRAFYPAAFHDLTSLLLGSGVSEVAVSLNVVSILLSAVVWPLSALFLATRLFGTRLEVVVITGILSAAFSSFPYRALSFGVLYPFHAALAVLPAVIALFVELFGRQQTKAPSMASLSLMLAASTVGLGLLHPSAVIAALVLSAPFCVARLVLDLPPKDEHQARRRSQLLATAYLLVASVCFVVVRPSIETSPWEPVMPLKQAVGTVLTISPGVGSFPVGLFLALMLGLVATARRPHALWPVAFMFFTAAAIFVAANGVTIDFLRNLISGVWYRDPERAAMLLSIGALPLTIAGALFAYRHIKHVLARFVLRGVMASTTSLLLIVCALILTTQRGPVGDAQLWLSQSFGNEGVTDLLTDDERQLLAEIPDLVPEDGVVVGNPRTGASLTPAFSNRTALAPHIFGARSEEESYLLLSWDEAGTDPRVCEAIRDLNAYWALDFGTKGVLGGTMDQLEGTNTLASGNTPGISEIARVGDVALYEANICELP